MSATEQRPDAPSHLDLIEAAHHVRDLARSSDPAALVPALRELHHDLVDHVALEVDDLDRLPGATASVARAGQEQVLALVERLVDGAGGHDPLDCVLGAVELEQRLRRQARLEATLRLRLLA